MRTTFSPEPRHRQLSQMLRKRLAADQLAPGDRFLSVRDISREYSVSPVTAHKSVQDLVAQDVLVVKPSKGCFVGRGAARVSAAHVTGPIITVLAADAVRDTHPMLSFETLRGLRERLPTAHVRQEYLPKSNPLAPVEAMILNSADDHQEHAFVLPSPVPELKDYVVKRRLPAVIIGSTDDQTPLPCIEFNEFELAYTAASMLLAKGCKQIFLLDRDRWVYGNELRYEGFAKALLEHGFIQDRSAADRLYIRMPPAEGVANAKLEALLATEQWPVGIISNQDRHAALAIRLAAARKLRIPQELMLISLEGSEMAEQLTPSLTSSPECGYEVGIWVGNFIEKLLHGRGEHVRHARHVIAPIIARETT